LNSPSSTSERSPAAAHSQGIGLAAIALAAVLWAISANVARALFDDGVDPLDLTPARAYLALICLATLRPWRVRPEGRTIALVAGLGLSIALVNATYYVTIERLPVAVAIVIQYTSPVLVIGWMSFGRRALPGPDVLLGLIGAVAGVVLVSELGSVSLSEIDGLGVALALCSACLFATYTLLSEAAESRLGTVGSMFWAFAVASVFWLIVQAFRGYPTELLGREYLPSVAFIGIVGTFAPFLLFVWGLKRVASERAVIAASLEPPAAAVVAWIWLGQSLSLLQIVGGVLVLAAVVALQARVHEPARAPEP
jgi:drug/metabolite transporter, DME family